MAESGGNVESGGGSWWEGWLQSAKEKSVAALDMVRKDLAEFGCTMQKDTGHVVEVTSTTLKESLKAENTSAAKDKMARGLNAFLEGVSRALTVPPDDDDQIPITSSTAEEMFDRAKARRRAVQLDPGTYLNEPSGSPEDYEKWCEEEFSMDAVKGEISELLVSKVEVRALYTKLVPSQVSHVDFWRRYFYKLHQIELDQARKQALMQRAEITGTDDSLSWEDDWSGDEEDEGSDWERLPRPGQDASKGKSRQEQKSRDTSASHAAPTPKPPSAAQGSGEETKKTLQSPPPTTAFAAKDMSVTSSGGGTVEGRLGVPVEVPTTPAVSVSSQPVVEKAVSVSFPQPADGEGESDTSKPSAVDDGSGATAARASPQEAAGKEKSHQADTVHNDSAGADRGDGGDTSVQYIDAAGVAEGAAGACEPAAESAPVSDAPASASLPASMALPQAAETIKQEGAVSMAAPLEGMLSVDVLGQEEEHALKTVDKGDIVVVGSDHSSPLSAASDSNSKDVDEEWEQDLDIELTEEDMKAAEELAKQLGENINLEDDWESWE